MPQSEHYLSQSERLGYYDETIRCLNAGVPGPSILRKVPPLMEKATLCRMKEELSRGADLFQYGIEEGDYKYRQALAKFLSSEYDASVHSENLILTSGASSALWNILTLLFKPGVIVFVEDVTYFIAIKMFRDFGAKIIPVKTDAEGIVPEDFARQLETCSQLFAHFSDALNLPLKAMIYLVPVFHNPTGRTMSKERCSQILEMVAPQQILIVCDDVYNLLHHNATGQAPQRMFSCTKNENVISNGSFSKFLAPGLRLGWLEAPLWMVEKHKNWGVVDSGGGLNTYTAGIVGTMMSMGLLQEHLQVVRVEYKKRMLTLKSALQTNLPEGCKIISPCDGGYFIWVELPLLVDATRFQEFAKKEYHLNFMPGTNASTVGGHNNFVRLSASMYEDEILEASAKQFSEAIRDFQARAAINRDFYK